MFNITNDQRNADQNYNEVPPHTPSDWLLFKKPKETKRVSAIVGKGVEKLKLLCIAGGNSVATM